MPKSYNCRSKSIPVFVLLLICLANASVSGDGIPKIENPIVIDSVEIDNRNIYDTSDPQYAHWIFGLANKLHIKTRKHVIRRELLIGEGDEYSAELADETERNLRTRQYIWNAEIALEKGDNGENILRVTTSDRWTLIGGPSINRSSGLTTYQLGFEESNFLGFGQLVRADYFIRDFDDDYHSFTFTDYRIFGTRQQISFHYNGNPEVGAKKVSLSRPFYSLGSRFAFETDYENVDRRDDWYSDGVIVGQNRSRADKYRLKMTRRFGTYHTKFKVGALYCYADREITNRQTFDDNIEIVFPGDSLYHYMEPQFGLEDVRYLRTRRIRIFTRVEDITLTRGIYFRYGRAWDAGSGKWLYDKLGLEGAYSAYYRSNLLKVWILRQRCFKNGVDFRKLFNLSIRYYNNRLLWYTPVIALVYSSDYRQDGMKALYLGENHGIRGYEKNFINGEKIIRANIENRFFTGVAAMSNVIGAVQFVDVGQAWSRGEELDLRDMYWSIGVGLRLGTERLVNREAVRIDLAYAGRTGNWEISFGLGQYIY